MQTLTAKQEFTNSVTSWTVEIKKSAVIRFVCSVVVQEHHYDNAFY